MGIVFHCPCTTTTSKLFNACVRLPENGAGPSAGIFLLSPWTVSSRSNATKPGLGLKLAPFLFRGLCRRRRGGFPPTRPPPPTLSCPKYAAGPFQQVRSCSGSPGPFPYLALQPPMLGTPRPCTPSANVGSRSYFQ